MRMAEPASARTPARLLGKMNSTKCVIPPAPLFYRNLQMTLSDALETNSQNYESMLTRHLGRAEMVGHRDAETSSFRGKLQNLCLAPGGLKQTSPMTHYFPSGTAGVLNRIQIPFVAL